MGEENYFYLCVLILILFPALFVFQSVFYE